MYLNCLSLLKERSIRLRFRVWQSSAFKQRRGPDPRQRFRVKLCIHPDPLPVAKIDLDRSVPGGR